MNHWLNRVRPHAPDWRTLVSGILIVLAFPPWNFAPLIWFAIVPWLAALERAPSYRAAAKQGLWLGIFMSLGGFYWVAYVLAQFAGLPLSVSIFGLLLFSLINQPQFILFAPIWRHLHARSARPAILLIPSLALIYSGIDWILPKLFVDTFGHAFHGSERIRQVADLAGAHWLTFLAILSNLAIHRLWRDRGDWQPAALAAALAGASLAYGHFRLAEIRSLMGQPHPTVRFGVIQANIGDFEKLAAESGVRGAAHQVMRTFFTLSDEALRAPKKPDVLVWPETSYPSTFRSPSVADELYLDQELERYVRERGVPLLFGGYDHLAGKDFNAFFFLSHKPQPGVAGQGDLVAYRKNMLLLFGEYIPGAETFEFIKKAFPQVGNFGRGVGAVALPVPLADGRKLLAGPAICYEVLFPEYVRAAANLGSQLILNITNDSWFGPTGEPHLHLALSTFRTIETRLPMLRSTNTGISALVQPDGTVTQQTRLFVPEVMHADVPVLPAVWTLFKAWGDWFGRLSVVLGLVALALLIRDTRRQRRG